MWSNFGRMLDSAFEQIRLYSQTDVAVSLRMMRALGDIAVTLPDPEDRRTLVERGRRIVEGCAEKLGEQEMKELRARLAGLEKLLVGPPPQLAETGLFAPPPGSRGESPCSSSYTIEF